jgi:hypothetical protein
VFVWEQRRFQPEHSLSKTLAQNSWMSFPHQRKKTVYINICLQTLSFHGIAHFLITVLSFIHSIAMCRMRWFLAVLRSFFHSSLSYTFPCHSSLPAMLPAYLTSSCHLFLGLPIGLVASNFILNTFLGILSSSSCSKKGELGVLPVP